MPSRYEEQALRDIADWKSPPRTWWRKALVAASWPLDKAGDLVMEIPGVGWVIEKSVGGLVSLLNDMAQLSVRPASIYAEFRKAGHHDVQGSEDILRLDLEDVDRVVGWLAAKYKGLAVAEGAVTGLGGLAGIPPDIVALITLNLRAIGEFGTYYGFDVTCQHERLYALNILGLASSPNDAAKNAAMGQLAKIASDVAKKKAWKDLERSAFVRLLQQIAKALGVRLTKAKLAQIVPLAGAATGGGFNSYYTAKVTTAAYQLYRERFVQTKYGDALGT